MEAPPSLAGASKVRALYNCPVGKNMRLMGEFPAPKIIRELEADNLLPAILFRTSRRQCDNDVERVSQSKGCELPQDTQDNLKKTIEEIILKFSIENDIVAGHPQFPALLRFGVGAHHAGQLLMWRLLLEELMSRGLLRLMIATGTVAAGVDFPARTVVITAHSKRGSEGFNVLTSSEFQQMSGRAGRRGKDSVGICLVAPSHFSDARVILEVAKRPPEPLRSAYFAAPSTMLNLLKYRNVDDLRFTVGKSLASFIDRKSSVHLREQAVHQQLDATENTTLTSETKKRLEKRIRKEIREADLLENRQAKLLEDSLAGLERLGYVEKGSLTTKGYWAANLCTSLVLEIAEAIEAGLLYDIPVPEIVGLVGSIAGDPHRNYLSIRANPIKKSTFDELQTIVTRTHETYTGQKTGGCEVVPDAALTVLTWMDCENWGEFAALLRLAGVAEGDAARLITQTADHLNQISRLEDSHPQLAEAAIEGRKKILKPPLTEQVVTD